MTRRHGLQLVAIAIALSSLLACADEPVVETVLRPVRFVEVSRSGDAQARTLEALDYAVATAVLPRDGEAGRAK